MFGSLEIRDTSIIVRDLSVSENRSVFSPSTGSTSSGWIRRGLCCPTSSATVFVVPMWPSQTWWPSLIDQRFMSICHRKVQCLASSHRGNGTLPKHGCPPTSTLLSSWQQTLTRRALSDCDLGPLQRHLERLLWTGCRESNKVTYSGKWIRHVNLCTVTLASEYGIQPRKPLPVSVSTVLLYLRHLSQEAEVRECSLNPYLATVNQMLQDTGFRRPVLGHYADYSMYSTLLTASPGSVLFGRSDLLKRKDLCFSYFRLGLIRHRRSLKSSHLFSSGLTRFCRVITREVDFSVNSSIGIQIVLFCWLTS